MNAQTSPINDFDFESDIANVGFDLSSLQKAEPLKTAEEIKQEWLSQRRGKFTASEFHRLMTCLTKSNLPVGAMTYATEKAVELLTADPLPNTNFVSRDMQWGLDHELDAIAAFEQKTGLAVSHTGVNQSLIMKGDSIGGTPDGLINQNSAVEIKCPNSTTHLKYFGIRSAETLKTIAPNYYWQIQGLLHITGRDHWYFISYDPRYTDVNLRLYWVKILPNEQDIDLLSQRLQMGIEYRDEILKHTL